MSTLFNLGLELIELRDAIDDTVKRVLYLVDVDAPAANTEPDGPIVVKQRVVIVTVAMFGRVIVNRARTVRRPIKRPAAARNRVVGLISVNEHLLRCQRSIQRRTGIRGGGTVRHPTVSSFRSATIAGPKEPLLTGQVVLLLLLKQELLLLVRFLRISEPVEVKTIVNLSAGCLFDVKELG